jgi:segregation and condensation protein A
VELQIEGFEQTELPYQVRIENFEGPLDLLFHLIKKNEINIYDIPIAMIAQQYLAYVEAMKDLNLNVAGEFLVMAATLLQIKSKMLLPVNDTADDEEDRPDPREELVRRLLEYKTYKEAARQLDGQEKMWREIFSREQGPPAPIETDDTLLENVSLFDLVDALRGILDRNHGKQIIEIIPDNLTVRERISVILEMLEGKDSVSFMDLFEQSCHRLVVIVTFLAMLELIRLQDVRVFQAETFGPILVSRTFSLVPDPAELEDSDLEWRGT